MTGTFIVGFVEATGAFTMGFVEAFVEASNEAFVEAFTEVFVEAFTGAFTGAFIVAFVGASDEAFAGATVVTLVAGLDGITGFKLIFLTKEVSTTGADVCCFNGDVNGDFGSLVFGNGGSE